MIGYGAMVKLKQSRHTCKAQAATRYFRGLGRGSDALCAEFGHGYSERSGRGVSVSGAWILVGGGSITLFLMAILLVVPCRICSIILYYTLPGLSEVFRGFRGFRALGLRGEDSFACRFMVSSTVSGVVSLLIWVLTRVTKLMTP